MGDAFGGCAQGRVSAAASTTSAVAVFGHRNAKGVGAKMRNLAEKVDGRLRVSAFQFAICGAHAAEATNAAIGAYGFASDAGAADFLQAAIPTFLEVAGTKIVAIAVGKNTDGHLALRIDGAAVVATAAGVALRGDEKISSQFGFDQAEILRMPHGIAEFQCDRLLR